MEDKRVDIVFELINRQQFVDDLERDELYSAVSIIPQAGVLFCYITMLVSVCYVPVTGRIW